MNLLYFILGIIFIHVIIPLVDSILELIVTWLESKKSCYGLKIAKTNLEIQHIVDNSENNCDNSHAIGFRVANECEEEEEYNEDN